MTQKKNYGYKTVIYCIANALDTFVTFWVFVDINACCMYFDVTMNGNINIFTAVIRVLMVS